jgi:hypothetical protein
MDLICKDAYVYIYIYNFEHVHASPSNLSLKPVGVVGRPHPRVPFWGKYDSWPSRDVSWFVIQQWYEGISNQQTSSGHCSRANLTKARNQEPALPRMGSALVAWQTSGRKGRCVEHAPHARILSSVKSWIKNDRISIGYHKTGWLKRLWIHCRMITDHPTMLWSKCKGAINVECLSLLNQQKFPKQLALSLVP